MDDKIYTPEVVEDTPFPNTEADAVMADNKGSGDVYAPQAITGKVFPRRVLATETISSALNTKSRKIIAEFTFIEMGAIQVGKYENGVSGDMRLSPNGIVGRNKDGDTTFGLDATTGDATFKGEIKSGSLVTGLVVVGDNALVLDGASRTIIVNDGNNDRVLIGNLNI